MGNGQPFAARSALRGGRFAELVTSVSDPRAMVTADWSLAETAIHVTAIAWQYTALLQPGQARPGRAPARRAAGPHSRHHRRHRP